MLSIHPQARTTPAVRREITRSAEPAGVLAKRFGVSTETIRKWRKRGTEDCQDLAAGPTSCPGKPPRKNAPSSVPCAARPAFRSMI
jgi:transposase-like protein